LIRIAVTGSSGYVGSNLIRRIASADWVEAILAVDIRPPSQPYPANVSHVTHDVRASLDSLFTEFAPDAVVHLAFVLEPGRDRSTIRDVDLNGTANALSATVASGARHFLYFSSTTIYGPHPDNPEWLTEDSPPRPLTGFQYAVDKLDAEQLISKFSASHPEVSVGVLRGCPVMGPTADNFVSRAFAKRVLVGVWGYDPPMQLLHEDDLMDVLEMSLRERVSGTYNIAGEGLLHWREMAGLLGRSVVSLPAPLLYTIAEASWALRLQSEAPAAGLAFIQHRWTASTEKIKADLNVRFAHTSTDAWVAYAERLGRRNARATPSP
jgi:UDP-glucose 4-epimerase